MPDPNTQLMNLAARADALAQSMKADRKAEGKMFEWARECGDLRGVGRPVPPGRVYATARPVPDSRPPPLEKERDP